MIFTKDNYYQEKFTDLNIGKEIIKGVEFEDCQFINCTFLETTFQKCLFLDCQLDGCNISALNPLSSRFNDVRFENSKVIGLDWTKADQIQELSFNNCQINYSNFRMLKLPKIIITNCQAKELDFTETDLKESNLSGTDFEKTVFYKTNLTKADFRGSKNYYLDIHNNTLTKALFSLPEAISLLASLNIVLE